MSALNYYATESPRKGQYRRLPAVWGMCSDAIIILLLLVVGITRQTESCLEDEGEEEEGQVDHERRRMEMRSIRGGGRRGAGALIPELAQAGGGTETWEWRQQKVCLQQVCLL